MVAPKKANKMNISYNWLKRLIDFRLSPRELAAALTSLGLECDTVEEVESICGGLRGVVVGKVLTCVEHPNSDHLHITTVDLGTGEPVQIVCGAPNVAAGQTVVVATVGTTLYQGDDEFKIKKSKIRGVESSGMICAEDEIGVGTDHAGIMVLPDGAAAPGTPAAEYFGLTSDWCLEVELTPNRVDAASHLGTARDLKAWMECNMAKGESTDASPVLRLPSVEGFHSDRPEGATPVHVEDTEGCPRYVGVTIRGVKVAESPKWLRDLLTAAGQRPINNIVDITNFILLGLGQPLHSFDLGKVAGGRIEVRTCPAGTPFTTLDGVEHKLDSADLMICDAEKPLCIAGVFGGLDSGVTDTTTDVFIESAYFNPTRVRKTARRHGLSTDASFRYERGTDPNILPYAAKLAALMIREMAGGEICGELSDTRPQGFEPFPVEFSLDYCNRLIGKEIPRDVVLAILHALEIDADGEGDTLHLQVPRYRVDVTRPCDVVEEVLRVYGYNNVEFGMEMHATLSQKNATDFSFDEQNVVSDMLTARGYQEIMNNSLTAIDYYNGNEVFPLEKCVSLLNPLSRDLGVMRQTLLYGGLESIRRNVNRKAPDLRLYEFGNVYSRRPDVESTPEKPLAPFSEATHLALWNTGAAAPRATWGVKPEQITFFDLKADVEALLARMGIKASQVKMEQTDDALFGAALRLTGNGGKQAGIMGILRPAVTKPFDVETPVFYAEFDWRVLMKMARTDVTFAPLPRTMPVRRDLALLIDKDVTFAAVEQAVRQAERKLVGDVWLFDVYEGDKIPEGKKSYAVAITLQDAEKTLNDKQIDAVMGKIVRRLQDAVGAQLR